MHIPDTTPTWDVVWYRLGIWWYQTLSLLVEGVFLPMHHSSARFERVTEVKKKWTKINSTDNTVVFFPLKPLLLVTSQSTEAAARFNKTTKGQTRHSDHEASNLLVWSFSV